MKMLLGYLLTFILLFPVVLLCPLLSVSAQSDGLIASYPFNGNGNDESGNGHDGSVYGATLTTDRFGNPDSAYSFDGDNDLIEVADDNDFDFGTGGFTISAWINTTAITNVGAGRDDIVAKGDPTISGFAISIRNNRAAFWVGSSGELFGSSVLNDGEWHHILGTRDDSSNIVLYVDGIAENSGTNIESVYTGYNIFIGKHGIKNESYFNGFIDDVKIYDRAVLPEVVESIVDFDPDTINIKSRGKVNTSEISIEAYIDGRSQLIIAANNVQWHHLDWAAPGRLDFVNEPTIINGIEWFPQWADLPDAENRWCSCNSSIYEDLDPALPQLDTEIELEIIQARYSINIVQHPSEENNYILILEFNDNPIEGAAWYRCVLTVTYQTDNQMHSKAPVTVYIELPEGYDVNEIDINSILLNGVVSAEPKPATIDDYDGDGTPDLMVKFDRSDVKAILDPGNEVEVTVSGELLDGTPFEGTDTIRVIK